MKLFLYAPYLAQGIHIVKKNVLSTQDQVWEPKIVKEETVASDWSIEETDDCRCPPGQFWYAVGDADGNVYFYIQARFKHF